MHNVIIFLIVLISILCHPVYSQNNNQTPVPGSDNRWEKLFPVTVPIEEAGQDICQTTDGNYIMVGYSDDYYYRVKKINPQGDTIWSRKFKATGSFRSNAYCCYPLENGSVLVSGYASFSFYYAFISKIDSSGNLLWDKNFSAQELTYYPREIIKTKDGGFLIQGEDFLLKLDSSLNYMWSKKKSEYNAYVIYSITEGKSDSNLYSCIFELNYGPSIFKLDKNGNIIWLKDISSRYFISCIKRINNEFFIFGDINDSAPDTTNFIKMKMDTSGNIYSLDSVNVYRSENFYTFSFNVINANRLIFASNTIPGGPIQESLIRITDSNLNVIRTQRITTYNEGYKAIKNLKVISDNKIMGIGFGSPVFLGGTEQFYGISTDTNLYFQNVWINKEENSIPNEYSLYQNYPNPFNSITNIKFQIINAGIVKLDIYDILGRQVKTLVNEYKQPGTYQVSFNAEGLSSDVYFYRIETSNFTITKKCVLLK